LNVFADAGLSRLSGGLPDRSGLTVIASACIRAIIGIITASVVLALAVPAQAEIRHGLRDENGRHYAPRGFVMNTNVGKEQVVFQPEDYWRMARMPFSPFRRFQAHLSGGFAPLVEDQTVEVVGQIGKRERLATNAPVSARACVRQ
jgi:hypothetical protein